MCFRPREPCLGDGEPMWHRKSAWSKSESTIVVGWTFCPVGGRVVMLTLISGIDNEDECLRASSSDPTYILSPISPCQPRLRIGACRLPFQQIVSVTMCTLQSENDWEPDVALQKLIIADPLCADPISALRKKKLQQGNLPAGKFSSR